MNWVTVAFCNAGCAILCIILARKKNRAPLAWFLLAFPAGFLALFLLLALPALPQSGREANLEEPPR